MREELIDEVCEWLEDNLYNYVETKSRGQEEVLTRINTSALIEDLRETLKL